MIAHRSCYDDKAGCILGFAVVLAMVTVVTWLCIITQLEWVGETKPAQPAVETRHPLEP